MTSIGRRAFLDCSSLNILILEDGETNLKIRSDSFESCPLNILYLGRDLTNIDDYPFYKSHKFIEISFGKYVTNAEYIPLYDCENLEVINSFNPIPPIISACTDLQYKNLTVNIPIGSLTTYQKDRNWSKFWNLKETLPSTDAGIESIIDLNAPVEYFNLQGMKVANPEKGTVTIMKQGKVTKKVIF